MTNFLWIEDFPANGQPSVTVANVFGSILEKATIIPDIPRQVVRALRQQGVFLQLTLSSALAFIDDPAQMEKVDFIVLDIDLTVYDNLIKDFEIVAPILRKWYGYEAGMPEAADFDEIMLFKACDELKKVAGYHLWAKLIVDLGFPKERILYCSDHGNNLLSINDSFRMAKLEIPAIHVKSDRRVNEWINSKANDCYVLFRRAIIDSCEDILQSLYRGELKFRLPSLPGDGATEINHFHAEELLKLLPNLLPFRPGDENARQRVLRQFVVSLAHIWERIDPGQMIAQNKEAGKQLWQTWLIAFSWVMKFVRNSTAHSSEALSTITEEDAAFLFLVNCRAQFELEHSSMSFDKSLLGFLDNNYLERLVPADAMIKDMRSSYDEIAATVCSFPEITSSVFGLRLSQLHKAKSPVIMNEKSMRWVHQLFLHGLYKRNR